MPLNYENGMKLFTRNCREMMVSFDMSQEDISYDKAALGFLVNYGPEIYKNVRNTRSFGFYDLWSQIGGFVGMFLGYSLLQSPDILQGVILSLKKYCSVKISKKHKFSKRMVSRYGRVKQGEVKDHNKRSIYS